MCKEYEKSYLEYKKKVIIDIVNRFKVRHGSNAFPFELDESNLNLQELFCNQKLCKNCRRCCSNAPCVFSPHDFLDICDIDYMKNILNTGLVCISNSPNNSEILVLRPRGVKDKKIVSFAYAGNPCVLRDISGCMFSEEYRPSQGLLQVPYEDGIVIMHKIMYSNEEYEEDYKPFQNVLNSLASEYFSQSNPILEINIDEQFNNLIRSLARKDN